MLVHMHIWEFPLSLILAAAFILLCLLCSGKSRSSAAVSLLTGRKASTVLFAALALSLAIEGSWGLEVHHSWPFLIILLLSILSLSITAADGWKKRMPAGYTLYHLGFAIILYGGFFGAPDVRDAVVVVNRDSSAHIAYTDRGEAVHLPFALRLTDFRIDYYGDGISPKQYTSTVTASDVNTEAVNNDTSLDTGGKELKTSVNHPARHKGWRIYQLDYDHNYDRKYGSDYDGAAGTGEEAAYSVLKLVRDPWLPIVFLGMALMALAAVLSMKGVWHSKAVLPVVLGLAIIFGFISIARISFGTLVPALRSLWFIPHLIIYMVAYSVMAIALISSIVSLSRRKSSSPSAPGSSDLQSKAESMARKLLSSASALMLIGMLCGAVWAKSAWGQYWTWDSKECWAAVTWLLTLIGTHIPPGKRRASSRTILMIAILIAFLAMQITWYGVNWLPSSASSLHTYNL